MEYEAYFHELAQHATSILGTDHVRVCFFVKWLRFPLCISTQSLVIVDISLTKVSNHA